MASAIARLASVFQKARDLLSVQYIRSVSRRLSVLRGRICAGETHIADARTFCRTVPRRTGLRNGVQVYGTFRHSGHSYNLKRRDDLGLPKAVVKNVAENERIADVPINALYITVFLDCSISARNRRRIL